MRQALASTVLRSLRASSSGGATCGASGQAVRAFSSQEPITATLFPGDGECGATTRRVLSWTDG